MTTTKKKRSRTARTGLVVYRSKDGWRWRWVHENYDIGAESGEAYANQSGCRRGWADFMADIAQRVAK